MKSPPRHGSETLRRLGISIMIPGAVMFLLPALPADPLLSAHELFELTMRHYWWQLSGMAVYVLGNTLRLIGVQGHPGLPLPVRLGGLPPELAARIQLRRRAWENRAKALELAAAGR